MLIAEDKMLELVSEESETIILENEEAFDK